MEYLALRGGPREFSPGFPCPDLLGCFPGVSSRSPTGLSPATAKLSRMFDWTKDFLLPESSGKDSGKSHDTVYATPPGLHVYGLGCSPFARRY